ncbi:alpha/beta fold hydrolase [Nocardia macrotermitis]|uniref:2-succinyl-6-hydroxy-2, 4-cyclohexadiene-1-carboxylate synthase n=1 Tax=Nocardia macrotermitis TaxID=2585198 RepID=A0A7K0DB44_9NOCA|nr:alpha/beta hydrolase [Nocardia macrotermitis]MQY23015.1 2-succinyl-6-hydroxy-2,4-cyclohexadiene-1-carboxylate synthase [Nocardia macrotermitis]
MSLPDFHHALNIAADDGIHLAATRVGRPSSAATLVYIHPLLRERGFWSPLTARMHELLCGAVTQITYDQRGHGDSDRPDLDQITTVRRLAQDLHSVLEHASGSVVLVTHSTGAQLLHAYATVHRDRAADLAGLVLLNAAAEPPALPRYARTWPHRLIRIRRHRALAPVAAAGEAVLGYRLRHTGLVPGLGVDPRVSIDVLAAHAGFGFFTGIAQALRHIPSAVLAGEHDTLVPPQHAVRLADALWADYDIVAGAGHELPRTHPGRAADTITTTLDHALRTDLEQPRPDTAHTPEAGRDQA